MVLGPVGESKESAHNMSRTEVWDGGRATLSWSVVGSTVATVAPSGSQKDILGVLTWGHVLVTTAVLP